MNIDEHALIRCMETSLFGFPELPGKCEHIHIPGLSGRVMAGSSHPISSMVGDAALSAGEVDGVIDQVYRRFAGAGRAFSWLVGPSSRPGDLPERLAGRGLVKSLEMSGMVSPTDLALTQVPDVLVRRAQAEDMAEVVRLYRDAYPIPARLAEVFAELISAVGGHHYLAYEDEDEEPVAVANLWPAPSLPVAILQGAATLSEHRGRGIYTNLLAYRLRDAAAHGLTAAILQADRATSAPICQALGFRELCSLTLFAWEPARAVS